MCIETTPKGNIVTEERLDEIAAAAAIIHCPMQIVNELTFAVRALKIQVESLKSENDSLKARINEINNDVVEKR